MHGTILSLARRLLVILFRHRRRDLPRSTMSCPPLLCQWVIPTFIDGSFLLRPGPPAANGAMTKIHFRSLFPTSCYDEEGTVRIAQYE